MDTIYNTGSDYNNRILFGMVKVGDSKKESYIIFSCFVHFLLHPNRNSLAE